MRESYGTAIVTTAVVILTFIFAGYLAVSIKYSRAFKIKNEVITIIEKYNGISSGSTSEKIINDYLKSAGHRFIGACPDGWEGHGENKGSMYSYCTLKVYSPRGNGNRYYKVKLFFQFGLPIIDNIATFDVDGETIDLRS